MQVEFLRDRARAQLGQKVDATASIMVSASSAIDVPFGALLCQDESDPFLCKIPTTKVDLDKALGVALRQHYGQSYPPKSSILILKKGRIWVEAEEVKAPGDAVYIKFAEDGRYNFTGTKAGNTQLKGAIFLEASSSGLVPMEINLFGGAK